MTDILWNQFMDYAEDFAKVIDLDEEERNYKLEFAKRAEVSRQLFLDQDPEWFESLRKSLQTGAQLSQFFLMSFIEDGRNRPEELWQVLVGLWGTSPRPGSLDDFATKFRPLNQGRYTTGAATTLGSYLLLSVDPTMYPPYRTEGVKKFMKLVAWADGRDNGTPTERYGHFLEALDEIKRLADERGMNIRDRLDAQGLMWSVLKLDAPQSWPVSRRREFQQWRGDKVIEPESPRSRDFGPAPEVEAAARLIIDPGVADGMSPLDPTVVTWTETNARELHRVITELDVGTGSFMERFERQLAGVSREVVLLAAELIYLQVLPLVNVLSATKIKRVKTVLSWTSPAPKLSEKLLSGLETGGVFNGGMGFNLQQWQHLTWLCRFIINLRTNDDLEDDPLESPFAFHTATASTRQDVPGIRYCLEYLAWPAFFEPIVNKDHRLAIRNAFAHEIGGASGSSDFDIATDLHSIRRVQADRTGEIVHWYYEPYVHRWQSTTPVVRAWLVRQNQSGTSLIDRWLEDGFVSTKATHLGSPAPGSKLEEIQAAVSAGYDHVDYAERKLRSKEYFLFLSSMKEEDLVLTAHENKLFVGVITGEAQYAAEADSRLRRTVAWQERAVPNENLPAPMPRLLEEQGQVVELTDAMSIIGAWIGTEPQPGPAVTEPIKPQAAIVPILPDASEDLAHTLHIGRDHLQEIFELLQTRNQIVFYGPPGTGKTFLAGKLARYLVGEEFADHVTTVQFHPSYAYEDFFEGYRPAQGKDGSVGFSLEPGPLRIIAAEAAAEGNRDKPYFLIVDEMNRGNLAKVFGELYFLLEYRDQSINLQYNPSEKFVLPPNLFIIGTMNTADRSIAMVDAAIRRRFAFVELHPQEEPIEGLLERYLQANSKDLRPALLLNALNRAIEQQDRDFMIGPSYFMKPHAETSEGLRRIWKYELLPLLEEHYFGRLSRDEVRERFGLDGLERTISQSTSRVGFGFVPEDGVSVNSSYEAAAAADATEPERETQ